MALRFYPCASLCAFQISDNIYFLENHPCLHHTIKNHQMCAVKDTRLITQRRDRCCFCSLNAEKVDNAHTFTRSTHTHTLYKHTHMCLQLLKHKTNTFTNKKNFLLHLNQQLWRFLSDNLHFLFCFLLFCWGCFTADVCVCVFVQTEFIKHTHTHKH